MVSKLGNGRQKLLLDWSSIALNEDWKLSFITA
jgi:hypothetical protein